MVRSPSEEGTNLEMEGSSVIPRSASSNGAGSQLYCGQVKLHLPELAASLLRMLEAWSDAMLSLVAGHYATMNISVLQHTVDDGFACCLCV